MLYLITIFRSNTIDLMSKTILNQTVLVLPTPVADIHNDRIIKKIICQKFQISLKRLQQCEGQRISNLVRVNNKKITIIVKTANSDWSQIFSWEAPLLNSQHRMRVQIRSQLLIFACVEEFSLPNLFLFNDPLILGNSAQLFYLYRQDCFLSRLWPVFFYLAQQGFTFSAIFDRVSLLFRVILLINIGSIN